LSNAGTEAQAGVSNYRSCALSVSDYSIKPFNIGNNRALNDAGE
jgi:hypothetical protein